MPVCVRRKASQRAGVEASPHPPPKKGCEAVKLWNLSHESIQNKKIMATGMQFPKVMAKTAAIYADEYFKGKRDFPKKMPVAVELVTRENVNDYTGYGKKE